MAVHKNSRAYDMSVRRKAADATTERILDAAFALLESGGPAATTISATARRAGVQRLTVYRRFADDEALMQAALERELRRDPPPDPSTWSAACMSASSSAKRR